MVGRLHRAAAVDGAAWALRRRAEKAGGGRWAADELRALRLGGSRLVGLHDRLAACCRAAGAAAAALRGRRIEARRNLLLLLCHVARKPGARHALATQPLHLIRLGERRRARTEPGRGVGSSLLVNGLQLFPDLDLRLGLFVSQPIACARGEQSEGEIPSWRLQL